MLEITRLNSAYRCPNALRSGMAVGDGSIDILIFSDSKGVLLETMRVGNRVQTPSATGNGISVRLCSSEDFPAD